MYYKYLINSLVCIAFFLLSIMSKIDENKIKKSKKNKTSFFSSILTKKKSGTFVIKVPDFLLFAQ